MTERTREKELEALKAGIASLREEIAALATGMKKFAETRAAKPPTEGGHEATEQEGPGASTDFQHTLDEAWTQSEKVVKTLAAEIERHPLAGSLVAFVLGLIIARLWCGGGKR